MTNRERAIKTMTQLAAEYIEAGLTAQVVITDKSASLITYRFSRTIIFA